jgi:uncharacterized membrane protein YhaH (DUF805 family)
MILNLHRWTGIFVALFLFSHIAVHLLALAGPDTHNAALKSVQWLYRNPVIEPLLILALLFQIGLGIRLAIRRWREPGKSGWAKLQLASGFYLTYFTVNHSGAALYTRYVGKLDTNFWWVSGPLHHPTMQGFFYPYYALAVLSVGAHLGAVLHFRGKNRAARIALWGTTPIVLAYWSSFGGWLYPVTLKADYRAFYDALLANIGLG